MSVAQLPIPTVIVEEDRVVFDGFVEGDPHVIEALRACTDPENCAHELLQLGARLSGLAAGTGGLAELEARVGSRLDTLAGATQVAVTDGLTELAEKSRSLFAAEDGEVARTLRTFRGDVERYLGEAFDPDRKKSLVAGMERSLTAVLDAYGRRLTTAVDPDVPDSQAGRLLTQVRNNAAEMKAELAALAVAVGVDRGRSAEHARSAVKGTEFEPMVLEAVAAIAAPHGDLVEHVARQRGVKGTTKGDILVTLCQDDLGAGGSYVIEAKDRKLTFNATWRELDAAMANWEAGAAVAVFASGHLAPTDIPFWHSGERAIVVLNRDDPEPAALALACLFARWVVRRRAAVTGTGADPERIAAGIDRIQRALARVSTIRRNLSTSTRATDDAREQLDELAAEVRDALDDLAAEVDR